LAVAFVWPSAARWVGAWAAASLVLLEIDGFHVPTDIAGGLLLALLAGGLARREAWY
jgi:Co/Zn/Cd efflux system component